MKYDCNKTLDFSHECRRMCDSMRACEACPLHTRCKDLIDVTAKHIDIVQKWSDEHLEQPKLTKLTKREHEFLKTFLVLTDKAIVRGKLMSDLCIHDTRCDMYYWIDPTMFPFIREEEQMTFDELLKLEVEE